MTASHFWAPLLDARPTIGTFLHHGLCASVLIIESFELTARSNSLKLSTGGLWMFDCGEGTQHQVSLQISFILAFHLHLFVFLIGSQMLRTRHQNPPVPMSAQSVERLYVPLRFCFSHPILNFSAMQIHHAHAWRPHLRNPCES